jgi:hypothetical protein
MPTPFNRRRQAPELVNVMPIDPIEAYPPKWLNKDNVDRLLGTFAHTVTIKSIGYETVGAKEERAVVWRFLEVRQGFICKRPHHNTAAELYGENTDHWLGQRVQIKRNPKFGASAGETGLIILPPRQTPSAMLNQDGGDGSVGL